jgi:hypothetical protein
VKLLVAIFSIACACSSFAATITVTFGPLRDLGGTIATSSFVWMLVVDTDRDGFSDPTPGDFVGGSSDDLVVFKDVNGRSDGAIVAVSAVPNPADVAGLDSDDPFRVVWFPAESSVGAGSSGAELVGGEAFGSFRTDAATDGGTNGFLYPGDGNSINVNALTSELGGATSAALLTAGGTVLIPEPSTSLLVGLAFGFLFVRRK